MAKLLKGSSATLVTVLIGALVAGGVFLYFRNYTQAPPAEPLPTQSDWEIYSSEEYSFSYPNGYAITLPTQSFPALTVEKARNKRVEIFQMEDFGDRPWGFDGTETQEDIDGYVPKETLTVGGGSKQYDVWLFYSENDTRVRDETRAIFESIVVE